MMVRRLAVLVAILVLALPAAALAGQNAGAAILVSCGSVTKTTPASCAALQTDEDCFVLAHSVNTQLAPLLSWIAVYVGREFVPLTSLSGVDFGIYYDANALYDPTWTHCGTLEVNGAGWPQPGTGNTVVWASPQSGTVLVGYFTVAKYAGYPSPSYDWVLGEHPLYGTARAADGSNNFDDLRHPAVANLMGFGGGNPCHGDPILPTTWGQIKGQYRD
jgi:hypothetical protein